MNHITKSGKYTYLLRYKIVFVIKYRKPIIDDEIASFLTDSANELLLAWNGKIVSHSYKKDYIEFVMELPPTSNLSNIIRSLKIPLAKRVWNRYGDTCRKYLSDKTHSLWENSYFIETISTESDTAFEEFLKKQHLTDERRPYNRRSKPKS